MRRMKKYPKPLADLKMRFNYSNLTIKESKLCYVSYEKNLRNILTFRIVPKPFIGGDNKVKFQIQINIFYPVKNSNINTYVRHDVYIDLNEFSKIFEFYIKWKDLERYQTLCDLMHLNFDLEKLEEVVHIIDDVIIYILEKIGEEKVTEIVKEYFQKQNNNNTVTSLKDMLGGE
jgi:hypothetical protein